MQLETSPSIYPNVHYIRYVRQIAQLQINLRQFAYIKDCRLSQLYDTRAHTPPTAGPHSYGCSSGISVVQCCRRTSEGAFTPYIPQTHTGDVQYMSQVILSIMQMCCVRFPQISMCTEQMLVNLLWKHHRLAMEPS